jgi:hypothetical protein
MAEIKTLIIGDTIHYKGLVDLKGFNKVMDTFFREKGYDRQEIHNEEQVLEDKKELLMKLMPYKKITDYAKIEFFIIVTITDMKEVTIEKEKIKMKLLKGSINVDIDTYLVTDYEGSWETKPFYFFVRTLFDKFVYKTYTEKFEAQAMKEAKELKHEMKSYLNMHRFY